MGFAATQQAGRENAARTALFSDIFVPQPEPSPVRPAMDKIPISRHANPVRRSEEGGRQREDWAEPKGPSEGGLRRPSR